MIPTYAEFLTSVFEQIKPMVNPNLVECIEPMLSNNYSLLHSLWYNGVTVEQAASIVYANDNIRSYQ